MLKKKRENPSKQPNKKDKKKSTSKNNKNNNVNNNKLYSFDFNQNYTLDGYGKLKLNEGNFSIMGYSLSNNEIIDFNFNEDYPLFKYTNPSKSKFEIFEESKYHLYTDINSLVHVSYIPKPLVNLEYENFSKFFICGNKCVGKNMLMPYIFNRILSNKNKKLYFLECDIIHPLIPFNFCISLINITKPVITNIPILLNENNYQMIKSIYIRNSFDIKNVIKIIDSLINDFYAKTADNNSILLINQFSFWDNNYDVLNNYIYQKYFNHENKSCLIYIKNQYKIIESLSSENKEKNNTSILEDIIFKKKDDFYLFGNIFANSDNQNINKICTKVEVELNFRYGDDDSNCILDLNNKKKLEEKLSILNHFTINKCIKYSISLNDIIFLFDNPFINEFSSECKTDNDYKTLNDIIINSLINKYCAILRNNLNQDNKYIFLDDVDNNLLEIISFTKVISFNQEKNELNLFCDIDINEEIKKNKKILIISEHRIEKVLKKNRKDNFNEIMTNAEFSYDLTNDINENKIFNNGLNYLGNNDDDIL